MIEVRQTMEALVLRGAAPLSADLAYGHVLARTE